MPRAIKNREHLIKMINTLVDENTVMKRIKLGEQLWAGKIDYEEYQRYDEIYKLEAEEFKNELDEWIKEED